MTPVQFTVTVEFDAPPREVWAELVDWKGHEEWIPATRVVLDNGDTTAAGVTFTAWTGYGPFRLEDRMRVAGCRWNDETSSGSCEVEKLGPILRGRAGFTVEPNGKGARVEWFEDVTVPRLPRFLGPLVARAGALGFRLGMRGLNRSLAAVPG